MSTNVTQSSHYTELQISTTSTWTVSALHVGLRWGIPTLLACGELSVVATTLQRYLFTCSAEGRVCVRVDIRMCVSAHLLQKRSVFCSASQSHTARQKECEHSTPTVIACCVHCTTRGSHTHTHTSPQHTNCSTTGYATTAVMQHVPVR